VKLAFGQGTAAGSDWVATLSKELGFTFQEVNTDTVESLVEGTTGCDAIIVALHKLTAEKIAALPPSVKCIGRLGVGLDNIDLEAAKERKTPVIFQPTYAFNEVANHALAMMMALHRGLFQAHNGVKNSEWIPAPKVAHIASLQDSTLGVVGCGRIGQALIEKARPLFKSIVGFDPAVTGEIPGVKMVSSLDELLSQSKFVSLHAPYMKSTHHMIGAREMALMPKGSILVNVSRGGLIDEDALIGALESDHLDGAGLDVFETEPLPESSPLRKTKNLILTPHIAWYSQSAGPRLMEWGIKDVLSYLQGGNQLNGKFAVGPF
jgi:D-3-phosphoglycerate dehydrogenase / 2-oxoglutarate reductase